MQPALDCETCGALTPAARFRYFGDCLICEACGSQNPQGRVRPVSRDLLVPRTICLNFVPSDGYTVQAMHLDHRTGIRPPREDQERRDTAALARLSGRNGRATSRIR